MAARLTSVVKTTMLVFICRSGSAPCTGTPGLRLTLRWMTAW